MLTNGELLLHHDTLHCTSLTESRMLPNTRLAPMPAKPAALPKALEGTRRSLNFFFTSSFCSLICKEQQRNTQKCLLPQHLALRKAKLNRLTKGIVFQCGLKSKKTCWSVHQRWLNRCGCQRHNTMHQSAWHYNLLLRWHQVHTTAKSNKAARIAIKNGASLKQLPVT